MNITVKYENSEQMFPECESLVIANKNCEFPIDTLNNDEILKLIFVEKYNGFVLINVCKNQKILCNGKIFSKILVKSDFELIIPSLSESIKIQISNDTNFELRNDLSNTTSALTQNTATATVMQEKIMQLKSDNVFDNDIEKSRIAIIKEIGFKISEFKNSVKTSNFLNFVLTGITGILSVISAFGITNYLLGLKIDNSSSTINLTTNFWFLAAITLVILAVCISMKYAVSSVVNFNSVARKYGTNDVVQKAIIGISLVFLLVIYVLNLCYYKSISVFTSLFLSLLFVGGLAVVAIGSGYFHGQVKILKQHLDAYEYREDFESVIKSYRSLISMYINKLSQNKINSIKSNLVNNQMRMVLEFIIGVVTAPFLAYGVSNTLAGCFPEAANWVRISGLRFSPIFLVLATFLIIFAFLSFVRAFTIGKQIKGSEIIKFDGFHDYNRHGVTILGFDSMKGLEKEKSFVLFVASFIILIEFTMNVSYFITEIGGDIQGMFLSFVTALVPTALLIAETHMLSATMYKIHNLSELLENLD